MVCVHKVLHCVHWTHSCPFVNAALCSLYKCLSCFVAKTLLWVIYASVCWCALCMNIDTQIMAESEGILLHTFVIAIMLWDLSGFFFSPFSIMPETCFLKKIVSFAHIHPSVFCWSPLCLEHHTACDCCITECMFWENLSLQSHNRASKPQSAPLISFPQQTQTSAAGQRWHFSRRMAWQIIMR